MNVTPENVFLYILFLWSTIWKGIALWKASKNNQRNWFIAILVVNTLGILEVAYLLYYAKHRIKVPLLQHWGLTKS